MRKGDPAKGGPYARMTVVESHGIVHLVGEPDDIWNVAASDASDDEAGEAQGPVGGVQSYEAKVVYPGVCGAAFCSLHPPPLTHASPPSVVCNRARGG